MAKLRPADDAVSPVIATILLVAITVTLAGGVFLMLNELGDPKEQRPNAAFKDEQVAQRLVVISAPHDLDWEHIIVRHDGCGVPLLNSVDSLTSGTRVADSRDMVTAGDYIQVFPSGSCEVRLTHIGSNSLLGTWTFR